MNDGSIRVETRLDNSKLEPDLKEMEQMMGRTASNVEKASSQISPMSAKGLERTINKWNKELAKTSAQLDEVNAKIAEIQASTDEDLKLAATDEQAAHVLEMEEVMLKGLNICKRNGIKKLVWSTSKDERVNHKNGCNITVHRDYDNKACPGEYLYSRMGQIANEVNAKLGTASQSATKQTAAKTTKAKDKNIAAFQKWLNSYYKSGLTVDGIYGVKTKAAAVKAFQTYANAKLGLKLKVNGTFDKDTKAAASKLNVKIGSVNRVVRIAQGMLYCKGYNAGGFDGIFGTGMRKAVKRYQSANGLTSDGIVGSNTFAKLFA